MSFITEAVQQGHTRHLGPVLQRTSLHLQVNDTLSGAEPAGVGRRETLRRLLKCLGGCGRAVRGREGLGRGVKGCEVLGRTVKGWEGL